MVSSCKADEYCLCGWDKFDLPRGGCFAEVLVEGKCFLEGVAVYDGVGEGKPFDVCHRFTFRVQGWVCCVPPELEIVQQS